MPATVVAQLYFEVSPSSWISSAPWRWPAVGGGFLCVVQRRHDVLKLFLQQVAAPYPDFQATLIAKHFVILPFRGKVEQQYLAVSAV